MSAINGAGLLDDPLPVQDSLFFKLQGAPEVVAATADLIQKIASVHGSERFAFAKTDEEADALWTQSQLNCGRGPRGGLAAACMPHVYMNNTHEPLLERGCKFKMVQILSIFYTREVFGE